MPKLIHLAPASSAYGWTRDGFRILYKNLTIDYILNKIYIIYAYWQLRYIFSVFQTLQTRSIPVQTLKFAPKDGKS
ncbi:MAG: hypothetical protein D6680_12505 [Cyanobacteria bacterium J007]|nr:MAG: hypothetical protein D6680_12505 [Cyanobacteria bacterium J007]